MGLFRKDNREGGMMDVIRCDLPATDYLIWKWSPDGVPSRKMNAIRSNSSLRVRTGQVAAFVYTSENGSPVDFIEGPQDQFLKTANLPVLSSIIGTAYNGESPFQAEVYFINTAYNQRLAFFIPDMLLATKEHERISVPAAVKASVNFSVKDYRTFTKHYSLASFDVEALKVNMRDTLVSKSRSVIARTVFESEFSLLQAQNYTDEIAERITSKLRDILHEEFAVELVRVNIESIVLDSSSEAYQALDTAKKIELAAVDDEHLKELNRIRREEAQRRTRLNTETDYITTHQLNIQGEVARTAAESLGQMGGSGDSGGFNPAGMMAGMMMGGAVGGNLANMVGGVMNNVGATPPPPPPVAQPVYYVLLNGQQQGPCNISRVREMVSQGMIQRNTLVWKQNTPAWAEAGRFPELSDLFAPVPPPPPPAI